MILEGSRSTNHLCFIVRHYWFHRSAFQAPPMCRSTLNLNGNQMQNTSHAVMAQRTEQKDSFDDFPTPPWATRALIEHVIKRDLTNNNCLEPACGNGHMSRPLKEYFRTVHSSDIHPYGYGSTINFLDNNFKNNSFDWIITNPPFNLAEEFIYESLRVSKFGTAMLTRTVFIESIGRYNRLFSKNPPNIFAQFSERVPMIKGRLDKKASTATGYAWLVWEKVSSTEPILKWIPPCRKKLERPDDYPTDNSSQSIS